MIWTVSTTKETTEQKQIDRKNAFTQSSMGGRYNCIVDWQFSKFYEAERRSKPSYLRGLALLYANFLND